MPATPQPCAACGSAPMVTHLRVAGDAGADGLIPTTDRFGTALADIVRCRECGHMQVEPMPSAAALGEAYGEAASDDYIGEQKGQRATAGAVLDRIESHAGTGAIADLGCWVGFLLDEARQRGWRATGVEPSAFASGWARENLGLDVVRAELLEAELPRSAFEAVFMGDVIEHLPQPGAALERIAGLLAPEGVVALVTPNAGSRLARIMGRRWWSVIPTHVQYFTRGSITRLLTRHGYEVLEVRTSPKAFTVRYYLERIAGYSPRLSRAMVAVAERLGLAGRIWAPDFRDRMLVIARPVPDSGTPSPER